MSKDAALNDIAVGIQEPRGASRPQFPDKGSQEIGGRSAACCVHHRKGEGTVRSKKAVPEDLEKCGIHIFHLQKDTFPVTDKTFHLLQIFLRAGNLTPPGLPFLCIPFIHLHNSPTPSQSSPCHPSYCRNCSD